MIVIDPEIPMADGILFDDLHGVPLHIQNMLAARRVVFLTEFEANGKTYGGKIVARSWSAAKNIAFSRGLDEQVVGTLREIGTV